MCHIEEDMLVFNILIVWTATVPPPMLTLDAPVLPLSVADVP